jgi:hypothetical protein
MDCRTAGVLPSYGASGGRRTTPLCTRVIGGRPEKCHLFLHRRARHGGMSRQNPFASRQAQAPASIRRDDEAANVLMPGREAPFPTAPAGGTPSRCPRERETASSRRGLVAPTPPRPTATKRAGRAVRPEHRGTVGKGSCQLWPRASMKDTLRPAVPVPGCREPKMAARKCRRFGAHSFLLPSLQMPPLHSTT